MEFNRLYIFLGIFVLTGCGTTQGTGHYTYSLELPNNPEVTLKVHNPMSEYEDQDIDVDIDAYPNFDITSVTFSTENENENSASIDVVPKHTGFLQFDRHVERLTLDHYEDMDEVSRVRHVYKQDVLIQCYPAIYNVYVVEYEDTDDRTIVMQYLIDYDPYYQVNLNYNAHTHAEYNTIFSPRVAIEQTFSPAYEFAESFELKYRYYCDEEYGYADDDDDE